VGLSTGPLLRWLSRREQANQTCLATTCTGWNLTFPPVLTREQIRNDVFGWCVQVAKWQVRVNQALGVTAWWARQD
jgi:hypothetical protein